MTDIYVGEYGKRILCDLDYDVSSATGTEIHFSAPSGGTSFVNSASVSILAANVTTSCGVFSANKTLEYYINHASNTASSEINVAGTWKVWFQINFGATKRLITPSFKFVAKDPG